MYIKEVFMAKTISVRLNFTLSLHITGGFGVLPLLYSSIKFLITSSLNSFLTSRMRKGTPNFFETFSALTKLCPSYIQRKTDTTSKPFLFKR